MSDKYNSCICSTFRQFLSGKVTKANNFRYGNLILLAYIIGV